MNRRPIGDTPTERVPDDSDIPVTSRSTWFGRLVVPLAVFAVVIAVFVGERSSIDHEVLLIAPDEVQLGNPVPFRSIVFGQLGAMEGPQLTPAHVTVRLMRGEQTIAETALRDSALGGMEGGLPVFEADAGEYVFEAQARIDGEVVASVRRPVNVVASPLHSTRVGRPATELQTLALEAVEIIEGETPPSRLDVRVVGAACVPEQPCTLLVHVGEPAAAVGVVGADRFAEVTGGIAAVEVTVHGPESRMVLEARRDDRVVARRAMRLPIALATPSLVQVEDRFVAAVLAQRSHVIVDAFTGDDAWIHSVTVPLDEDGFALPFDLPTGLFRVQVRADPYSADRSAVRWVAIGEPASLLEGWGGAPPPGDPALQFRWLTAPHEASVVPQPMGRSGLQDDLQRLAERQQSLRWIALVAMLLGIVVAVLVFLRRGIDSAIQAQRVMDETGDPELMSARHRRKTWLGALAIVFTVILAFVGAFALIVVRAHLLP